MRYLDFIPNTPEWLKFRKNSLGSSDSPVIMGVSPWKTIFELWKEKCGIEPEDISNWATNRGHELEPIILARLEKELNTVLAPDFVQHDEIDWLTASLDGLSIDGKFFLEIKVPNAIDHQLAIEGKIPEKYQWQVTKQFIVTKCEKGLYASYNPSFEQDLVYFWVYPNQNKIELLSQKEKEFWENYVLQKKSPPLCSEDFIDLSTDPEWSNLSEEYKFILQEEKLLESKKERVKNKLIRLSHNANAIGCGIKLRKETKQGNIEYKLIPELKGIDLEKYRKDPISYYRIISS